MRKFLIFLFFFPLAAFAQEKRVLFIGNSYTQYNNLPQLLKNLALSGGDSLYTEMNAPGGYTFQNHTTNSTTLSKIAQGNWHYVVLQEQSQLPSFPPAQVASQCYPYARALDSLVRLANPCTETIYYMTWGRKYGDQGNCASYPVLCTFNGMQSRLRTSYLEMGSDNNASVAPAGQAFKLSRERDSTVDLYTADNSHPSLEGSYLTACVFYATILKKTPVGLNYTAGINFTTAQFLQQVAADVVLDSIQTWNLNIDHPQPLSTIQVSGNTLHLTDASTNALANSWHIEGINYSGTTAQHTFTSNGTYQILQIVQNNCFTDSLVFTVNIGPVNVISILPENIRIYPNPVQHLLFVEAGNTFCYSVFSADGKLVLAGKSLNAIDVSGLNSGLYYLQLTNDSQQATLKFLRD